ncbi:hypothetical protein [Flavobacterium sp. CS20]|uniref:hypothetical protein n=1 Tax=Flavobacterium sp. CS20 TaxID=2775246 RepID=UPI001B3A15D1|nr:hypothetical protein [Flavobacterium sp. CS20]QTY27308.1 hypothetical protein IGB25_01625 [Flavobacterium sp. CS20]
MRFFLIILGLAFSIQCFSQQIIVSIVLEDTKREGYGVEMFYLFEDKNDFKKSVSKLNSITEREILNAFDMPLVEPNESLGKCQDIDTLQKRNIDFLRKSRKTKIEKRNIKILISVSPVSVDYCEFILTNKYWGSYDVNFKKATVIIANKNKGCSKRISKSYMKEIKELFKSIP